MADGRKQLGTQTFEQHVSRARRRGPHHAETAKAALSLTTSRLSHPPRRAPSRPPRPEPTHVPALRRHDATPARRAARGRNPGRRTRRATSSPRTSRRWATASNASAFAFAPSGLAGASRCSARASARWRLSLFPLLTASALPGWARPAAAWPVASRVILLLAVGVGLGWVPLGGAAREDANLIATRGRGAGAALDRGPPRYQGAGAVHGRPAGGGVGGRPRGDGPDRRWRVARLRGAGRARGGGRGGGSRGRRRARSPGAVGSGARLPGARDNGTGVAAALAAAEGWPAMRHRHPDHGRGGVRAGGRPDLRGPAGGRPARRRQS